MEIYVGLLAIITMSVYLLTDINSGKILHGYEESAKLTFWLLTIIMIFLQSLRANSVGGDLLNYAPGV